MIMFEFKNKSVYALVDLNHEAAAVYGFLAGRIGDHLAGRYDSECIDINFCIEGEYQEVVELNYELASGRKTTITKDKLIKMIKRFDISNGIKNKNEITLEK